MMYNYTHRSGGSRKQYKFVLVIIMVALVIFLNYNYLLRNDGEVTGDDQRTMEVKIVEKENEQQQQQHHNNNDNNQNNHNNHNNNNQNNQPNHNNDKVDRFISNDTPTFDHLDQSNQGIKFTFEKPLETWTWDREERSKCHYSNKRNYDENPVVIQFHGYNNDEKCDINCRGGGHSYNDGVFYQQGDKCIKSVFFTMENVQPYGNHDVISTINLQSDVPLPMFGWNQYTYAEQPHPKDSKSQGLVAAFISNCGPQRRLDWIKGMEEAGVKVDSYGRCYHNKDIPDRGRMDYNGEKLNIAASYKFLMAFENSAAEDYITEKTFGAFAKGIVPLIDGAPNSKKFAPNNHSAIFAMDFESPAAMAKYLLYLDKHDDEYNKYLEWKKTGPDRDWTAMIQIADIGCECRVCIRIADLHRKEVGMVFGDEKRRAKYIKVPSNWSREKGIVIYVRARGTFWFYSIPVPYGTTYSQLKEIISTSVSHVGDLYEVYDYDTKQKIISDKIHDETFSLRQEQEFEAVFVDMNFYFTNTPPPRRN